jgi:hydrocephalus-inducing protein
MARRRFVCLNVLIFSFKGADGGLDFGVLKVFDESKQSMSLKNKGRYEISYNFVFDTTKNTNIGDILTVVPPKGVLLPTERPTQVAVVFKSRSEISFKDETMLKCQVSQIIVEVFCRWKLRM